MPRRFTPEVVARHVGEMERLRDEALAVESALAEDIARAHPDWRASARNLCHYLALRNRDQRDLQRELMALGLSSLGRAEAHTLASIDAVLAALYRIGGFPPRAPTDLPVDFTAGPELLKAHTRALLGPLPSGRMTHIMVTMAAEAAEDPALVRALLEAGMDCARINCAHDGPDVWERIAVSTRTLARELGRPCRVIFDLPGPKLRTASLPEGPRTMHLRPQRGLRGEVLEPCRLLLFGEGHPPSQALPAHGYRIPLLGEGLAGWRSGDTLSFRDLRDRNRELAIVDTGDGYALAQLSESAWIESGIPMLLERGESLLAELRLGNLRAVEEPLVLRLGDLLWVVSEDVPARSATASSPARIGCTLAPVFRDAQPGEPIHFDDGKISGVIRDVVRSGRDAPRLEVEITAAAASGSKLRGDKGINLPQTRFHLPALTDDDLRILGHVAGLADLVGMSFVNEPEDVLELEGHLERLQRASVGIVLKIETARAFANLPRLILVGLRSPPLGVMVARGDLGVELGFERLAEVQEEILWLCEAAHVPVIWATQVLETLAKNGRPSRAEVTDAAMSARAECVMLNKGPYVLDAIRFLDDVLSRMQDHQVKKFSRLRRLSVCGLAGEALRARVRL